MVFDTFGEDRADLEVADETLGEFEMVASCGRSDADLRSFQPLEPFRNVIVIARGEATTLDVDVRIDVVGLVEVIFGSQTPTRWNVELGDETDALFLIASGPPNATAVTSNRPALIESGVVDVGTATEWPDDLDGELDPFIQFVMGPGSPTLFMGCERLERAEIRPK